MVTIPFGSRIRPLVSVTFLMLAVLVICPLTYFAAVLGASLGVATAGALAGPTAENAGAIIGGTLGVGVVLVGGGAFLARSSRRVGTRPPSDTTMRPNG